MAYRYMQKVVNWMITLGLCAAVGIVALIWIQAYRMLTI